MMPTLTLYGEAYSCAKAQKGADFVRLLDENNDILFFANGIADFTPYVLTNGSWESPLAVVAPTVGAYAALDGTIITLTIPASVKAETGLQVNFVAPCDCTIATGIRIGNVDFAVCNAMGRVVTGRGNIWCSGSEVSVLLDTENRKAYILNGNSEALTFTATVTTNWATNSNYYTQTISVPGILATDNPVVDVLTSNDNAATVLYRKAMCQVVRIVTNDDSIQVWSKQKSTVAFPIQLKVVR